MVIGFDFTSYLTKRENTEINDFVVLQGFFIVVTDYILPICLLHNYTTLSLAIFINLQCRYHQEVASTLHIYSVIHTYQGNYTHERSYLPSFNYFAQHGYSLDFTLPHHLPKIWNSFINWTCKKCHPKNDAAFDRC